MSASNVAVSSARGGAVNLTGASNAHGFATITVDGTNKSSGATRAGIDDNTTVISFHSSSGPHVIIPPEFDQKEGVAGPPDASPPDSAAPPGAAGEIQVKH